MSKNFFSSSKINCPGSWFWNIENNCPGSARAVDFWSSDFFSEKVDFGCSWGRKYKICSVRNLTNMIFLFFANRNARLDHFQTLKPKFWNRFSRALAGHCPGTARAVPSLKIAKIDFFNILYYFTPMSGRFQKGIELVVLPLKRFNDHSHHCSRIREK